ncbi:MAG: glycosyltransferase [Candidatus Sumerlaeota bacterium]|nr:glycosyltransferase [Candidatus Sumerlaeota bacterium]
MALSLTDSFLTRDEQAIILPPEEDQALHLMTLGQRILWAVILLGILCCFIWSWRSAFLWFNFTVMIFYVVMTVYKMAIISASVRSGSQITISPEEIAALDEATLPRYTILVPLFHESEMFEYVIQRLSRIDYPKDKLQILLLLEEKDKETIEACQRINPGAPFETLIVRDSYPRTKPKACDVGLARATGDFLVIYDAEDRPEPDQLKKAVIAFQKSAPEVACIQAKLNYYNRDHNLLTRWFTTEYSTWFDLYLPGLGRYDAPIPLGGTSNHFRTATLVELGGWDAYNVAEDCDLGIRLYKKGHRTKMLDSTTWEEACSDLGYWIRQRSRWIKGYMQTFFVHTRSPFKVIRRLGFKRFLHFLVLTGGMFFTYLINPFYWLLTLIWVIFRTEKIGAFFPAPVFIMGFICLFIGNFAFIYGSMLGCCKRGYYSLVKYALIVPPYWALMSIAAWKAFIQLIYKPHYWEKTKHGLTKAE